jgi:hypothetical protein
LSDKTRCLFIPFWLREGAAERLILLPTLPRIVSVEKIKRNLIQKFIQTFSDTKLLNLNLKVAHWRSFEAETGLDIDPIAITSENYPKRTEDINTL